MKNYIRQLSVFSGSLVIAIAAMLTFSLPQLAHASGNNCLWTGATDSNFSTTTNWSSCGGVAPGDGDNLIFDNTALTSGQGTLTDDITGVTYADVTFQGSGTVGYDINESPGVTFTVSGDIADTTTPTGTGTGAILDLPVTLTAATTNISSTSSIALGDIGTLYDLNIGSNDVVFSGAGQINNFEDIIGSGTITSSMNSGSNVSQNVASPNFTGSIDIQTGGLVYNSAASTLPDMFSAASGVIVENGATLFITDPFATTASLAESMIAGGTGDGQCTAGATNVNCGSIFADIDSASTLTLSGSITLSANTDFNSISTIKITGPLSGAFTVDNVAGTLIVASSANTSNTANGTYALTASPTPSGGSSSSGGSSAPKTPNTGAALIASKYGITLAITSVLAISLIFLAKKYNYLPSKKS